MTVFVGRFPVDCAWLAWGDWRACSVSSLCLLGVFQSTARGWRGATGAPAACRAAAATGSGHASLTVRATAVRSVRATTVRLRAATHSTALVICQPRNCTHLNVQTKDNKILKLYVYFEIVCFSYKFIESLQADKYCIVFGLCRLYSEMMRCHPLVSSSVDCAWLEWQAWRDCSATCGGGQQTRRRDWSGPFHGGEACQGHADETRTCNEHHCPGRASTTLSRDPMYTIT